MSEQFSANRAKVHFFYPFRLDRWESFRQGISAFVAEQNRDLYSALIETRKCLEQCFASQPGAVRSAVYEINSLLGDGSQCSDATLAAKIQALVRKLSVDSQETERPGQDLCCLELTELLQKHEAKVPERLMEFMRKTIGASELPLLKPPECHLGDDRGTRGYFERKQPYLEVRLRAEDLAIADPETLPDAVQKLPRHSSFRGKRKIRLASSITLMSTGFGCLKLKAHVANNEGLLELVDEIVFTADRRRRVTQALALRKRILLSERLRALIPRAVQRRTTAALEEILREYSTYLDTECIGDRLQLAIDEITLVRGELTAYDVIDIENLDRGLARGKEPLLLRKESDSRGSTLYAYFSNIVQEGLLAGLRRALTQDQHILEFINQHGPRKPKEGNGNTTREQLISSLSNLSFQGPTLAIEEHPYVSTFISAPSAYKELTSNKPNEVAEHFRKRVAMHNKDLTRILMKSKWAEIRPDWQQTTGAFDNVFYSDLVHMAVHIRSTLCLYYAPANAEEYLLIPELALAYKYREELNDTIRNQRILWFAYVTSDHLVTQDIRRISAALEDLKERSLREEFPEVIEGLADVVTGIDHRKIALAEIMEDPLSRKGGSSLFSEMIEKTGRAFHLDALYQNLKGKVERLDMLGIHVNENVQQYSGLRVQEGTRSAQLTLEILEAFIIGYYFTELTLKKEGGPLLKSLVALGAILTALPVITSIRRGRSRLAFENPSWLEKLEACGKVFGPSLLIAMFKPKANGFFNLSTFKVSVFLGSALVFTIVLVVLSAHEKVSRTSPPDPSPYIKRLLVQVIQELVAPARATISWTKRLNRKGEAPRKSGSPLAAETERHSATERERS